MRKNAAAKREGPCPYCKGTGRVLPSPATRFLSLREREGLNQGEMASMIGISRGQLANLETARTAPSIDLLLRTVDRFPDVTADWLLGR